eukprot:scaffold9689_cov79-Skeletonema_dohrnii-CCMP3373.AAC.8
MNHLARVVLAPWIAMNMIGCLLDGRILRSRMTVQSSHYNGKQFCAGHLRRCSDADTSSKCLSRVKDASICTIMASYNGSLEADDCRIHILRYDMVLES